MARLILGLNAFAGSGKSAVADYLVSAHGFKRVKFAGPLKAATRGLLLNSGLDEMTIERMIEGDLKEEENEILGTTPRAFMQWLGEGARQRFGDDFHVSKLIQRVIRLPADWRIVVDDVRYINESTAIRAMGGFILRVERPGVGPVNDHVSEHLVEDNIGTIVNDAGPRELWNDCDQVIEYLQGKLDERAAAAKADAEKRAQEAAA